MLLEPREVRRRWDNCSSRTFQRIVKAVWRRSALRPRSYGGRNGLTPLFTPRQADAIWKVWQRQKARAFVAMGKKIESRWQGAWAHRRAGRAERIVSVQELKRRAGR
jgi:hypothetical protein